MAETKAFIGFPAGILREDPIRLPVLQNEPDWYALNKSAGIPARVHPWYANQPDITSAIRNQIQSGKGELKRLRIENTYYVCGPEPEVSGPVLFAKNKQMAAVLKNGLGSDRFTFSFWLVAEGDVSEPEFDCCLPVAAHATEPRALISHRTGKKSLTAFTRIGQSVEYSLWKVESSHARMHQIRLHASESGLRVIGETLYGETSLKGLNTRPLPGRFSGLALAMVGMDFTSVAGKNAILRAELPKRYFVFLKKTGLLMA